MKAEPKPMDAGKNVRKKIPSGLIQILATTVMPTVGGSKVNNITLGRPCGLLLGQKREHCGSLL